MKAQRHFGRIIAVGLMAFTLAGCASSYDRKANNTMMGAGLGAATGAIFSGGDPMYAIGGAAAGGLLGNILTEDRSYRSGKRGHNREYRRSGRDHRSSGHHNRRGHRR